MVHLLSFRVLNESHRLRPIVTRQPPKVVNMYLSKELERRITGEGYQNEHWEYVVTMSIAAETGGNNEVRAGQ